MEGLLRSEQLVGQGMDNIKFKFLAKASLCVGILAVQSYRFLVVYLSCTLKVVVHLNLFSSMVCAFLIIVYIQYFRYGLSVLFFT